MKKQQMYLVITIVICSILGASIVAAAVLMSSPDSDQPAAEPPAETLTEMQTEVTESASATPTDAEFFKAMPEDQQARLIAIICLATEQGNSPADISETVAENFDNFSEDYANSLVTASIITVCKDALE